MVDIEQFNLKVERSFKERAPNVSRLKSILENSLGVLFKNDHVAFRTLGVNGSNLNVFAEFLTDLGYKEQAFYDFQKKKLRAMSFVNHDNESIPRVFVSEPKLNEFSDLVQFFAKEQEKDTCYMELNDLIRPTRLCMGGLHIPYSIYEKICDESEYMGWVLVNGMIPNHFTLSISNTGLIFEDILKSITKAGYLLNNPEDPIQKTEDLWQASTIANTEVVTFFNGVKKAVPTCFYEFALRFNDFDGFVIENADKIFESTDRQ